jgi:hypothetical protein
MGDVDLLPVRAQGAQGINRVPSAMAARLAAVTGLPIEDGVVQQHRRPHAHPTASPARRGPWSPRAR